MAHCQMTPLLSAMTNWGGAYPLPSMGLRSSVTYDAAGRITASTNALGVFKNTYDGNSFRKASQSYPNGQTVEFDYAGNLQDQHLQRITNKLGTTPISEFIYGHDVPTGQITSWSQQAGARDAFNLQFSLRPGGSTDRCFCVGGR